VGGQLIIQGYGEYYDYPVAVYNPTAKTYTQIGQATKMDGYKNTLYAVYSETNWSTYETTNTFYTYDVTTGKVNNASFLKDAPAELASTSVYMLSIDPKNGEIYIGTSDYSTNGTIYRFDNAGNLIDTFTSGGVSPSKAVFLHD
jgi:hypothetical protein